MPDFSKLEKTLGITMKHRELLEQALVHSSYCNENPAAGTGYNERLEFLGDAVLDFIVAEKLYEEKPEMPEGQMSRQRAALVRRETLARAATGIGLGSYLYLGKGEESSGGRRKSANLAAALEAVIAAVYLDLGLAPAAQLVSRLLEKEWGPSRQKTVDFKSRLQEVTQARFQNIPEYRLVKTTGPDHNPEFSVEVRIAGRTAGKAAGKSKKTAENEAARLALEALDEGFTVA